LCLQGVYNACLRGIQPKYTTFILQKYTPKKTLIGVAVIPGVVGGFLGVGIVLFNLILFVGTGRSFCRLFPTINSRESKFIKRVEPRSVWILFFNITKIGGQFPTPPLGYPIRTSDSLLIGMCLLPLIGL